MQAKYADGGGIEFDGNAKVNTRRGGVRPGQ
jgi:hypothetical protein